MVVFPSIGAASERTRAVLSGTRGHALRALATLSTAIAWLFARAFGTTPNCWTNLEVEQALSRSHPSRGIRRLERSE
jgi:hypothetical protein